MKHREDGLQERQGRRKRKGKQIGCKCREHFLILLFLCASRAHWFSMLSLTPSFSPCLVAMNACIRVLSLSGLLATSRSYWLPEQGCWGCVFWGRGGRGGRVGCRVWVMRPGLSGDLELQKGSHRDLQEMTWHTSLNPVGKTLRKSFPLQSNNLFSLCKMKLPYIITQAQLRLLQTRFSRGTYQRPLWQSQAWLTSLYLISLFSVSIWVVHVT